MPELGEPVVKIRNLTVKFRYNVALSDINLEIGRGRTLLLGSNGSGKTTLMKVLSGLHRPTEGSVEVLGLDPFGEPSELYSRMLYVRDIEDLAYMVRVSTLVELLSDVYGVGRVDKALKTLELEEHLFKRVGELSKGLRRRVAMIEPLSSKTELIMMDEPFSGLDAESRIVIAKALSKLSKGVSLIIASHIPINLETDQIVVLEGGKLTYNGPYNETVAKKYLAWMDALT
ncbi:ATP-binding cassette domain-containing protein [Thermococcus sp.]|uniref:ATP-binding cassette domain-containing protein n=1 Tax=Thermococcus sp. TaxID=35749 RepID=UPI0025FCDB78|nr:ABC transporter ATP-binding protein [Thermococcus sp.]